MGPSEPHADVYEHVGGADDGGRHVDEEAEVGARDVGDDEEDCPGGGECSAFNDDGEDRHQGASADWLEDALHSPEPPGDQRGTVYVGKQCEGTVCNDPTVRQCGDAIPFLEFGKIVHHANCAYNKPKQRRRRENHDVTVVGADGP